LVCDIKEEHGLRVCGNRLLRLIFGPKQQEDEEAGKDCIMRSFMKCTLHKIMSW
jgi:hypothetical protein